VNALRVVASLRLFAASLFFPELSFAVESKMAYKENE
jgi:hypothetical protein